MILNAGGATCCFDLPCPCQRDRPSREIQTRANREGKAKRTTKYTTKKCVKKCITFSSLFFLFRLHSDKRPSSKEGRERFKAINFGIVVAKTTFESKNLNSNGSCALYITLFSRHKIPLVSGHVRLMPSWYIYLFIKVNMLKTNALSLAEQSDGARLSSFPLFTGRGGLYYLRARLSPRLFRAQSSLLLNG